MNREYLNTLKMGLPSPFPGGTSGREPACQCRRCRRHGFSPWVGKIPWSRKWQPIPVFLPGESHGQRCLVGYSPWGHKESDMTYQLNNNNKIIRRKFDSFSDLFTATLRFNFIWFLNIYYPFCYSKFCGFFHVLFYLCI